MRPDYSSLLDDFLVSAATAIIRLMFKIGKDGLTKTNWVSTLCITIGTIMLGVLGGFLANKTSITLLHDYHDLVVSLSTLYGKILLDKIEDWFTAKKIDLNIPGLKDESKPDAPGRAAE